MERDVKDRAERIIERQQHASNIARKSPVRGPFKGPENSRDSDTGSVTAASRGSRGLSGKRRTIKLGIAAPTDETVAMTWDKQKCRLIPQRKVYEALRIEMTPGEQKILK